MREETACIRELCRPRPSIEAVAAQSKCPRGMLQGGCIVVVDGDSLSYPRAVSLLRRFSVRLFSIIACSRLHWSSRAMEVVMVLLLYTHKVDWAERVGARRVLG